MSESDLKSFLGWLSDKLQGLKQGEDYTGDEEMLLYLLPNDVYTDKERYAELDKAVRNMLYKCEGICECFTALDECVKNLEKLKAQGVEENEYTTIYEQDQLIHEWCHDAYDSFENTFLIDFVEAEQDWEVQGKFYSFLGLQKYIDMITTIGGVKR